MNEHEQFIVGISPEGTRSKSSCWKTGFYYIAHGAGVPIVLAYLDYDRKAGGFGPVIETTGEIETDIETIRSYYLGITPKYPRKIGEIVVKPRPLT
jgi:1-acyl-sn-glycerol-3-phosphate acyltransferase